MINSSFFNASSMEWLQASLLPAEFTKVSVLPQPTLDALYPAYGLGPNGENVIRFLKDLAIWAETASDDDVKTLKQLQETNSEHVALPVPNIVAEHLYAAILPYPDDRRWRSIWGTGMWTATAIACDALYEDMEGAVKWRDRYLQIYGFNVTEYNWRGILS